MSWPSTGSTWSPAGRVPLAARPLRLRQDDDAAADRRLRAARRGQHPDRRRGRGAPAALPARREHRLPVVRALSAPEGARQRRLRASAPWSRQRRSASSAPARCSSSSVSGGRGAQAEAALGRPAAASGAGAGARDGAQGAAARRAAGRARPKRAEAAPDRAQANPAEVGVTFVYVTHDQEEALAMSDRVAVMNEGRIEQIGTPREIYDRPASRSWPFIGEPISSRGTARRSRCAPSGCKSPGEPGAETGLEGEVVATMVIGAAVQCVVRGDDGQDVLVREQRSGGRGQRPSGRGTRVFVLGRGRRADARPHERRRQAPDPPDMGAHIRPKRASSRRARRPRSSPPAAGSTGEQFGTSRRTARRRLGGTSSITTGPTT